MELSDFWDIFNMETEITEQILSDDTNQYHKATKSRIEEICYLNRIRKSEVLKY